MKKLLLFLILHSTFCIHYSFAQTNVSGFISANTTWNLVGSPYIVVGNALLSAGFTLTIDPGVIVKFNSDKALQIDGQLHAVGTATNRITFTSNQPVPAPGDWAKIQFADSSVNAVYDANNHYVSGSIMKYCDVMYGGSLGYGAVHVEYSSPYISNCRISYSSADGLHCIGYINIDSSSIKYNSNYGMVFGGVSPRCPVIVQYDSIEYNSNGGFLLGGGFTGGGGCDSPYYFIVKNNYFYSNFQNGAMYSPTGATGLLVISNNHFESNTLVGQPNGGIVNIFSHNYLIECNTFANNQTSSGAALYVFDEPGFPSHIIRNNTFTGNTSTSGYSAANIRGNQSGFIYFYDNIIKNNFSASGSVCKFRGSNGGVNIVNIQIRNNEFYNNQAVNNIYLEISGIGTPSMEFVTLSENNISNPNCQYEIYNDAPFGGLNNYVDSNYWGSVTTQHLDSVIYDYFEDATKSVVYYAPMLNIPAEVDTVCPPFVIGIETIENSSYTSKIFPNPFTATATISFSKQAFNATFSLYNLLGEKVKTISGINGESLVIDRGNLQSGVYVYEVIEKGIRIGRGKAVVY